MVKSIPRHHETSPKKSPRFFGLLLLVVAPPTVLWSAGGNPLPRSWTPPETWLDYISRSATSEDYIAWAIGTVWLVWAVVALFALGAIYELITTSPLPDHAAGSLTSRKVVIIPRVWTAPEDMTWWTAASSFLGDPSAAARLRAYNVGTMQEGYGPIGPGDEIIQAGWRLIAPAGLLTAASLTTESPPPQATPVPSPAADTPSDTAHQPPWVIGLQKDKPSQERSRPRRSARRRHQPTDDTAEADPTPPVHETPDITATTDPLYGVRRTLPEEAEPRSDPPEAQPDRQKWRLPLPSRRSKPTEPETPNDATQQGDDHDHGTQPDDDHHTPRWRIPLRKLQPGEDNGEDDEKPPVPEIPSRQPWAVLADPGGTSAPKGVTPHHPGIAAMHKVVAMAITRTALHALLDKPPIGSAPDGWSLGTDKRSWVLAHSTPNVIPQIRKPLLVPIGRSSSHVEWWLNLRELRVVVDGPEAPELLGLWVRDGTNNAVRAGSRPGTILGLSGLLHAVTAADGRITIRSLDVDLESPLVIDVDEALFSDEPPTADTAQADTGISVEDDWWSGDRWKDRYEEATKPHDSLSARQTQRDQSSAPPASETQPTQAAATPEPDQPQPAAPTTPKPDQPQPATPTPGTPATRLISGLITHDTPPQEPQPATTPKPDQPQPAAPTTPKPDQPQPATPTPGTPATRLISGLITHDTPPQEPQPATTPEPDQPQPAAPTTPKPDQPQPATPTPGTPATRLISGLITHDTPPQEPQPATTPEPDQPQPAAPTPSEPDQPQPAAPTPSEPDQPQPAAPTPSGGPADGRGQQTTLQDEKRETVTAPGWGDYVHDVREPVSAPDTPGQEPAPPQAEHVADTPVDREWLNKFIEAETAPTRGSIADEQATDEESEAAAELTPEAIQQYLGSIDTMNIRPAAPVGGVPADTSQDAPSRHGDGPQATRRQAGSARIDGPRPTLRGGGGPQATRGGAPTHLDVDPEPTIDFLIELMCLEHRIRTGAGEELPVSKSTARLLAAVYSGKNDPEGIIEFAFGRPADPDIYRHAYQDALDAALEYGLVETRDGGVWLRGDWEADWTRTLSHVRNREKAYLRSWLAKEFPDMSPAQASRQIQRFLGGVGLSETDRIDLLLAPELASL